MGIALKILEKLNKYLLERRRGFHRRTLAKINRESGLTLTEKDVWGSEIIEHSEKGMG